MIRNAIATDTSSGRPSAASRISVLIANLDRIASVEASPGTSIS
jgi:hypothetical protein